MFTGSLTENKMQIGIPPLLRQDLYDAARELGMQPQEFIRHILLCWREQRMERKK